MFVLAKCHARSKQMCDAAVVSFHFKSNGDDMHVGFQFESFVYIKPNGGIRTVRFQSAPGLQGDVGGAAIPAPAPAPASPQVPAPPPAGLHNDYGQIHNLCNAFRR